MYEFLHFLNHLIDPAVYPYFDLYPTVSGELELDNNKVALHVCYPYFDICEYVQC